MAVDSGVEMVSEGVIDDTDKGDEVVYEGEGDADVGVGVDEVCSAVDGVDDEGGGGGEVGFAGDVGFFTEESGACQVEIGL